jgi:hypothetical protein
MRQLVPGICLIAWTVLVSGKLLASDAAPPPDPKNYAVTDLSQVDADFAYQGEYSGWILDAGGRCRRTGLQIVARGAGKFDAVQFSGGLPGWGWDGQTKRAFVGDLREGVLLLSSDDGQTITTDGDFASVYHSSDALHGRLHKVQRAGSTLGARPPRRAVVVFDGRSTEHLDKARVTDEGLLQVGAITRFPVGDFRLHLEFRTPYMPYATGQGRGNSGVYIQQRYEVQVLDSFGLPGEANECGGLYRQQPPDVNMCLPPLAWQTYDIWFTAARFDDGGNKVTNARITVLHNGVAIHCDREITNKTGAGKPESPDRLPFLFQDHGNPVHFRNIWIVPCEEPTYVAVTAERHRRPAHCPLVRRLLSRWRHR